MLSIFTILFLISIIPSYNLNVYPEDNDEIIEIIEETNPKSAGCWNLAPFIIDDDGGGNYTWAEAVALPEGWCSGSGSWSDPYIIENVSINGGNSSNGIVIRDSNSYFKIKNCTLYNSGEYCAGIALVNTDNGQIIDNNCSDNAHQGIYLIDSKNNTIQSNNVNNNTNIGILIHNNCYNNTIWDNDLYKNVRAIFLDYCDNNTVSENDIIENGVGITSNQGYNNTFSENNILYSATGLVMHYSNNSKIFNNTISNSDMSGIYIEFSHYNIFLENTVNDNGCMGMHLNESNNNIISDNTFLGNKDGCILETNCINNTIEHNECDEAKDVKDDEDTDLAIQGYDLLLIIGIISAVSVLLLVKKKLNYKM